MDPETVKAEMRLYVLESLVALQWAAQHAVTPDPAGSLARMRAKLVEKAKKQGFHGVDPVFSDLLSAELEEAVEYAIGLQQGWMAGLSR